jgi:hypothetical protein
MGRQDSPAHSVIGRGQRRIRGVGQDEGAHINVGQHQARSQNRQVAEILGIMA